MGIGEPSAVQTKFNEYLAEWLSQSETGREIENILSTAILSDSDISDTTVSSDSLSLSTPNQPSSPLPSSKKVKGNDGTSLANNSLVQHSIEPDTTSIMSTSSNHKGQLHTGVDPSSDSSDETTIISPPGSLSNSHLIIDATLLRKNDSLTSSDHDPTSPEEFNANEQLETFSTPTKASKSQTSFGNDEVTNSPKKVSASSPQSGLSLSSLSLDATAFTQGRIVGSGFATQTGHKELGVMGIPQGDGVLTPVPKSTANPLLPADSSQSQSHVHVQVQGQNQNQNQNQNQPLNQIGSTLNSVSNLGYFSDLALDTPIVSPSTSPIHSPEKSNAFIDAHFIDNHQPPQSLSTEKESDPIDALDDLLSRSLCRLKHPPSRHNFYHDSYIRKRIAHCQEMMPILSQGYETKQLQACFEVVTMSIEKQGPSAMKPNVGILRDNFITITDEIFVLSTYLSATLFSKLLRYQMVWRTYPENSSIDDIVNLVYPATILRAHSEIFSYLDFDSRLFFALLPSIPPTRDSLTPIPQWVLRRFFVSDLHYDICLQRLITSRSGSKADLAKLFELEATLERSGYEIHPDGLVEAHRQESEFNPVEQPRYHPCSKGSTCTYNEYYKPCKHFGYMGCDEFPEGCSQSVIPLPSSNDSNPTVVECCCFSSHVLRQDAITYFPSKYLTRTFLTRLSFTPLMHDVLHSHPGLEFLLSSHDFQERYAQTVIARIFYTLNTRGDEMLTLREIRKSNLTEKLADLYHCDDTNLVHAYFSYEHFYVIYCKFWELDIDHDMFLSKQDLSRYEDNCLTQAILNSIFSQSPRKFLSQDPDRMSYEDFLIFLISEVEKNSPTAVTYWFQALDLDSDGVLTTYELSHFYEEQMARVKQFYNTEPMALPDAICQITDMFSPKSLAPVFTKKDVQRLGMFSHVCDMVFNLSRYLLTESRDVQRIRLQQTNPNQSDWERWAAQAYFVLAGSDVEEDLVAENTNGHNMTMEMANHGGMEMNSLQGMHMNGMDMHNMGGMDMHNMGGMHMMHYGQGSQGHDMNDLSILGHDMDMGREHDGYHSNSNYLHDMDDDSDDSMNH